MDFRGQPARSGRPVFLPPGSFGVPPVHHVGLTAEGIRGGTSFEQNLHAIGPLNPLGLVATGPGAGVDARATTSTARDARRDGGANGPRPKVMCEHPGCGKVFAWSQDLAKHVKKIHNREAPKFHCAHEGCGKAFHEKKLLTAHTRTHTDERPFACPHPGCDKAFRARNALAYHRKALHESGDVLRCDAPGCKARPVITLVPIRPRRRGERRSSRTDFCRRLSPPAPRSVSIPTHLDAFQLRF